MFPILAIARKDEQSELWARLMLRTAAKVHLTIALNP
jgi:hypothetical protein